MLTCQFSPRSIPASQPDDFTITTSGVDAEIHRPPAPQLVVPVVCSNAANARWAPSTTPCMAPMSSRDRRRRKRPRTARFRGDKVIACRKFLRRQCSAVVGFANGATGFTVEMASSWLPCG